MHKRRFLGTAVALGRLGASGRAMAQDNVFKIGLILPMTGQQAQRGGGPEETSLVHGLVLLGWSWRQVHGSPA